MLAIIKIALINLLLSSDNVLIIALFSQGLHKSRRILALTCSLIASVVLQLGILFVVSFLFHISFLQSLFGLLICYMAIKLIMQKRANKQTKKQSSLGYAIFKIVVGNLMMSFENEATLITMSNGNVWIAWIGILVTSPFIFFGSQLIALLLARYDFIMYIGSIVLFKIGLGLVFTFPMLKPYASIGGWGLAIIYGIIVAIVYLRKHEFLHFGSDREKV